MPRKTDASNPADWLWICACDLELLRFASERELSFIMLRSKTAEVLEKVMKAELIRLGWALVKTHDLLFLAKALREKQSGIVAAAEPLAIALAEAYMLDRYPGFDLDDPDWPVLRTQIAEVVALHAAVQAKIAAP